MDPITLIVTALAAGARATHRDAPPPALADAHAELVTFARQRLSGRPNGGMVLRQHAEDPARWARPLAKALAAEGADGDAGLVAAAQAVLRLTDEPGSSRGKYALDGASPSGQAPA
ncbi:MAG: hypothetical protein JWL68_5340 [Actinomycetia bacterium]|jgi:hypothetical protein|nr:hypothetical protein [Actinomycetes bacterium]MDX6338055.1 hypothetical protein [Streptosporangiaceae bacterium]